MHDVHLKLAQCCHGYYHHYPPNLARQKIVFNLFSSIILYFYISLGHLIVPSIDGPPSLYH